MDSIDNRAHILVGLGDPVGARDGTDDGTISWQDYSSGATIVDSPAGTFTVSGYIRECWQRFGGPLGPLGVPTMDEARTSEGNGRYCDFVHGSVFWSPTTGAHEIHGVIRDRWAKEGGEEGDLGYPITDELAGSVFHYQLFQYGTLRRSARGVERGCPPDQLVGIADTHTHPASYLGFGGNLVWGKPNGPFAKGLGHCEVAHGIAGTGFNVDNLWRIPTVMGVEQQAHHFTGGHPEYDGWPTYRSFPHQQMHVKWIERAYRHGLRVLVALACNSEVLAAGSSGSNSAADSAADDMSSVRTELKAIKELVSAEPWMQLVLSPEELRQAVSEDRLAVVLGVEVDSLGNWSVEGDCTRDDIDLLVDELIAMGIRVVYPIHLADNAFGGFAFYSDIFVIQSRLLRGRFPSVTGNSQVRFRLLESDLFTSIDAGPLGGVRLPGSFSNLDLAVLTADLRNFKQYLSELNELDPVGGHTNGLGLTERGEYLVRQLLTRGMLVDVDHMSMRATQRSLEIAEEMRRPVVSGHAAFVELGLEVGDSHNLKHEGMKSRETVERIARLGGYVSVIPATGDVINDIKTNPGIVTIDCPGSTATWARAYLYSCKHAAGRVSIGTDFNGFAVECCPRFGPETAYGISDRTTRRVALGRASNGVRYRTALQDYGSHRFDRGDTILDPEEQDIWEAMAIAFSDADIDNLNLPPLRIAINSWIRDLVIGLRSPSLSSIPNPAPFEVFPAPLVVLPGRHGWYDRKVVRRAAFLAQSGDRLTAGVWDDETRSLATRIRRELLRWKAMSTGPSRPIDRYVVGRHDWDYNLDGFAHYGLFPDFLSDLANVGIRWNREMMPLLRSSEAFAQAWERAAAPEPSAAPPDEIVLDPPSLAEGPVALQRRRR